MLTTKEFQEMEDRGFVFDNDGNIKWFRVYKRKWNACY